MGKYLKIAFPLLLLAAANFAWIAFIWHQRRVGVADYDTAQLINSDFTAFYLPWLLMFIAMLFVFNRMELYGGLKYPKIGRVMTAIALIFISDVAVEFAGLSPHSAWGLITINQYNGPASSR